MSSREEFAKFIGTADEEKLGFGDAVIISGIGARQLRNALDREVLRAGRKMPSVNRWIFSLRDCLQLMIVGELTKGAWVPISPAAEVAEAIAKAFDTWGCEIAQQMADLEFGTITEFVAYADDDGRTKVVVHKRGDGWGFYSLAGEQLDANSVQEVHVRIPAAGLFHRLITGYAMSVESRGTVDA